VAYQPPAAPRPLPYRQVKTVQGARADGGGCLWIGLNLMFLLFLAIGGWYGYGSWTLVQGGATAGGTVVRMDESDSDGSTTYAPIVEYVVDGETYTLNSTSYSSPPAFHVGQAVRVAYNRDNPSQARLDNFWELWLLPIIFISIAVLFGLIFNIFMGVSLVRRMTNRGA
jgi:hypothetical protein